MEKLRGAMKTYAADFETTTNPADCRVWAWGIADILTEEFEYGNNIYSFMEYAREKGGTIYFHNLKFDGNFILYWLLHNGYTHSSARKLNEMQFGTLISDMGMFYSITVRFKDSKAGFERKVKFLDSLKSIPLPISKMPKAFGLDIQKLEIQYEEEREEGHELTEEELMYLKNDVIILSRSLNKMHKMGMKKLTVGSNALNNFMTTIDKNEKKWRFPEITLTEDRDIRKAYKGGFTYVNPKHAGNIQKCGQVYDVNSMYPWAMKFCKLPYGNGIFYNGKYEYDEHFPLYIQCLECEFEVKENYIPTIQIKNNFRYSENEYLTKSNGPTLLHMTSIDMDLFMDHYHVYNIKWICGYKYRGQVGIFADYIDYWYDMKSKAKSEENDAMYTISKLMLNSLYGKFGTNPEKRSKYPYLDKENDIVRYRLMAPEIGKGGYIPIACFITAYARDKIIRAAQKCGNDFVYADTDSIHIIGDKVPDIEIDDYKLGAFKKESEFTKALFLRQKCYIETIDGKQNKKCAGMPDKVKEVLTYETLKKGESFDGKLLPKIVPGGVVLKDTKFTIK